MSTEIREHVSPEAAYHIARDNRHPLYFRNWLHRYPTDPAFHDFLPKLRSHLFSRICGIGGIGDEEQVDGVNGFTVLFLHECIYSHAILRINFTTYDLHRDQDFINPHTPKRFVMVASNDDSEEECRKYPFWYAQVLGIFHAEIFLSSKQQTPKPTRMEFLWVRWLGQDPTWKDGFKFHQLERIGFIPHEDKDAFGFLDPAAVIRATHLIPAFAYGRTIELCPPSVTRDDEGDWQYFYVNRFVDRDMLMRYLGLGVGHKSSFEKSYESNEPDFNADGRDVDTYSGGEQDEVGELDIENPEDNEVDSDTMDKEDINEEIGSAEETELEEFEY
ncbi:hypothetical protein Clacol_007810 [Clathrus columnatus]|uniref:Uncharacterized protein n=1 Tax=Clathrus columnatus TaxID=1419009 RepID=A0AAV5ANQ9_9AGAM|nr:hypothetical protein Clacol_007810 [Clathrus columnatus]